LSLDMELFFCFHPFFSSLNWKLEPFLFEITKAVAGHSKPGTFPGAPCRRRPRQMRRDPSTWPVFVGWNDAYGIFGDGYLWIFMDIYGCLWMFHDVYIYIYTCIYIYIIRNK
jgi:hypothetical protein